MNDNAYQETLFAEPLGMQLKHAREKAGLKMSDVSSQLKLPAQVVDALEREDWNALGASLYVKSYLSSYLKLLGLPPHLVNEARLNNLQAQTPVKILSAQPVRKNIDATLMKLAYFALTAAIVALIAMLAMHFQKPRDGNQVMPLDRQATELPIDSGAAATSNNQAATPAATNDASAPITGTAPSTPIMASMAPIAADNASNTGWTLTMNGDSWIEIIGNDGKRIDSGLISAGGQKNYALQDVASMKIGNAGAVELRRNGQVVDMTAFNIDNVARFNIGVDGALNKK
jgi:cytoskeleton protein RodZ